MKNNHLIAIGCFAVAGVLYFAALAKGAAVGLAVVGMCFEIVAWKNLLKRDPR
jgi:hypothetical protein